VRRAATDNLCMAREWWWCAGSVARGAAEWTGVSAVSVSLISLQLRATRGWPRLCSTTGTCTARDQRAECIAGLAVVSPCVKLNPCLQLVAPPSPAMASAASEKATKAVKKFQGVPSNQECFCCGQKVRGLAASRRPTLRRNVLSTSGRPWSRGTVWVRAHQRGDAPGCTPTWYGASATALHRHLPEYCVAPPLTFTHLLRTPRLHCVQGASCVVFDKEVAIFCCQVCGGVW